MRERKEFEMSDEEYNVLMDACKPVPYMIIGGIAPRSPQENANDAWARLGKKLGFDEMTVEPVQGKNSRFFSAIAITEVK